MLTVKDTMTGKTQQYASAIAPIPQGDKFEPNYNALKQHTGPMNIFKEDFDKHQKTGKTILVNHLGGWCFLTATDEIVEFAKA